MTQENEAEVPIDRLVRVYRKIRAAEQELTRKYDTEMDALKAQREQVAFALKDRVLALGNGVTSLKTDSGTVILGRKTRYNAQDWEALGQFILQHSALDLLEKRVAQKNMASFIEQHPETPPPGLNIVTEYEVSVRAPSAG